MEHVLQKIGVALDGGQLPCILRDDSLAVITLEHGFRERHVDWMGYMFTRRSQDPVLQVIPETYGAPPEVLLAPIGTSTDVFELLEAPVHQS